MVRLSALVLAVAVLLPGCYVYPYPYGYPTGAVPASFDRSWDAALGAAQEAGIDVTSADRATGRILGSKAGAAVTIDLRPQSDGSLVVSFSAPTARDANPTLDQRWTSAYNRRMGR
jgi:hypothetical protein